LTDLQAEKDNDKESSATSLPVNEKVAVPSMAVAEDGKSEDDAAGGNSLSILPPLRKKILLFCFVS
jgi:hypothetical protein